MRERQSWREFQYFMIWRQVPASPSVQSNWYFTALSAHSFYTPHIVKIVHSTSYVITIFTLEGKCLPARIWRHRACHKYQQVAAMTKFEGNTPVTPPLCNPVFATLQKPKHFCGKIWKIVVCILLLEHNIIIYDPPFAGGSVLFIYHNPST